ncbi:flagellar protein FlaG [Undibacterium amnicola]|uniref:Flagellar protein FlaG n=1 Tax=Undibacterium amnicola TaxID=1834038 RepID=A0ABR6XUG4_9BURK|nr:flagellar protein FlaG [Undibacterium amnicola]MBC3833114.1 flagellar protein FlaG [Undibacterium amnicola]
MSINQITAAVARVPGVVGSSASSETRVATREVSKSPAVKLESTEEVADTVSDAELKKSVEVINQFLNANNSINLNLDQESGKVLVQIVDKETNTVIRQIPSKEVLEMAKDLDKKNGMLLRDQA